MPGELERRLAELRTSAEGGVVGGEKLLQHLAAIDHLAAYAALLRASSDWQDIRSRYRPDRRYLLKLVLPDGRWELVETQLDGPPALGAVIDLATWGAWQVIGTQSRAASKQTSPVPLTSQSVEKSMVRAAPDRIG